MQLEKDKLKRAVLEPLYSFRLHIVAMRPDRMQQELKEPLPETEMFSLLRQYDDLMKIKQAFSEQLGRIILR